MYDGVIFDQDGVLLDSGINRFRWMERIRIQEAERRGFDLDGEDVMSLVRASSHKDVKELLDETGMTWENLKKLEETKENWKIEKIEQGDIQLFSDVKDTLSSLNKPVAMATNAPKLSTRFTVKYFGIEKQFETIKAPELDDMKSFYDRKKPKPVMIKEIMDELGLENPIMVGDSASDIKAAKNAGIDSVHINSYGFGNDADPTYEADNVREVVEMVAGKESQKIS